MTVHVTRDSCPEQGRTLFETNKKQRVRFGNVALTVACLFPFLCSHLYLTESTLDNKLDALSSVFLEL